jgi:AMP nucleosidase
LVSDKPLAPEGVKTSESDARVSRDWSDVHLSIGIDSLTDIGEKGEMIKHFQY